MSKKARGDILKIPFDCFSHILLFCDDPKDFVSLVLTIKRLLEHICKIVPSCTKNIPFRIYSIPKSSQEHVTFLVCSNVFSNGNDERLTMPYYYLISEFESTIDEFFDRLPEKFPNLIKLKITLPREKTKNGGLGGQREGRKIKLEDIQHFLCLTDLSLTFSGCPLKIERSFPKLQRLELLNAEPAVESRLELDWKGLVSLREVVLHGWNLYDYEKRNSLDQTTKKRLVKLHLVDTTEHEFTDFRSFDSLQDLSIKGTSFFNVWKIENAKSLRKLHAHLPTEMELNPEDVEKLSFLDLPSLESFHLRGDEKMPRDLDPLLSSVQVFQAFKIKDFPKLRNLSLDHLTFFITIQGVPDLQILCTEYCYQVDFLNKSEIPNGLLELDVLHSGLGDVILRHLLHRPKLPKLQKVRFSPSTNRGGFSSQRNLWVPEYKICDFTFKCLPDLHTLSLIPNDRSGPVDSHFFANYLLKAEEYPELKRLDVMRFNGCLVFNGYERSRLREVFVTSGGYLTLRNHPELQRVSFHGFFTQPVVIENCPQLRELKLNVRITVTHDESVLHLRNLPKCETLEIKNFQKFSENDGLRIENCPIRTLILTPAKGYIDQENRDEEYDFHLFEPMFDGIDITKKNFPMLEKIEMCTGARVRYGDKSYRIRRISGIDTLKTIELFGHGFWGYPFVRTVQGIDLEKVQVVVPQESLKKSFKVFI